MANNRIQFKRTSTTSRTPNTTNASNTQYIAAGELAINMADAKLYSSNGSTLIDFTAAYQTTAGLSSNVATLTANNSAYLGGIIASQYAYANQVGSTSTPVRQQYTGDGACTVFTVTSGYVANQIDVYVSGVKAYNGTDVDITDGTTFTFTTAPLNGQLIEVVGVQSYTQSSLVTYVQNTDSRTLSGNLYFTAANNYFSQGLKVGANTIVNTTAVSANTLSANVITVNGSAVLANNDSRTLSGNLNFTAANTYIANANIAVANFGTASGYVNSNLANTNYLGFNANNGQIFSDGNFHIHSGSGSLWINALDGSAIRLGTQTNSGTSPVIVDTSTVGHSFFTKASTAFNAAFDTSVAFDNLNVRVHQVSGSTGQLQFSAVSGSFSAYVSIYTNAAGAAAVNDTNSAGITFTSGTWSSAGSTKNISAGGDVTIAHVTDTTNSRVYRVTAIHCQGTTGAFITIERLV